MAAASTNDTNYIPLAVNQEVGTFRKFRARSLVPISESKYVAISRGSFHSPLSIYDETTDTWLTVDVSGIPDLNLSIQCAQFDPETHLFFMATYDEVIALDIRDPNEPIIKRRLNLDAITSLSSSTMILIGDNLHIFGTDERDEVQYAVIRKKSLTFNKHFRVIANYFRSVTNSIFLESENNIIVFGRHGNSNRHYSNQVGRHALGESRTFKCSLSTNQFTLCHNMIPRSILWTQSIVCTANQEYLIFLGGCMRTDRHNDYKSDQITIYNVKKRTFKKSAVVLPQGCGESIISSMEAATVMVSPHGDPLLTFGFVRESFKEQEFRHLQPLPRYLIDVIVKWQPSEYVHLVTRSGHWKVHIDRLL